jgi:putative IMPACT (imprinted ancient) family translation regulator
MTEQVLVVIGDSQIRFTPDGRIAVLDAIDALNAWESARSIWEALKRRHPDLDELCSEYTFKDNQKQCVVDATAWSQIQQWLFEYVMDRISSAAS